MNELDKLANEIITHNVRIDVLVSQVSQRYPGKTLAELLVEEVFR